MNLTNVFNELMKRAPSQKHYIILFIYFGVISVTSTIGHIMNNKNGFTNGMILGFVVSLALWYQYGRKMVY